MPRFVFPAYEDAFYYLWRERRLPANVDPFDSRLEDPMERARLAKVFEQGLDEIIGHVLPIARSAEGRAMADRDRGSCAANAVISCPAIRPSAIACRSIRSPGWLRATILSFMPRTRRAASRPGCRTPRFAGSFANAKPRTRTPKQEHVAKFPQGERAPLPKESAAGIARTSLCAQARNGVLYIFMPPVRELEHYVELVAAVEAAAEVLGQPVILEGYEPPSDPRLENFRVTPDPGRDRGQHSSVGDLGRAVGADHVSVRGGARDAPDDREIHAGRPAHRHRRRQSHRAGRRERARTRRSCAGPDLLRSLLSYWHNHPSLSYLVLGLVHRPHFAGAARGRGAQRFAVRTRDRLPPISGAGRERRAVGGGPAAAQSADRCLGQYPSKRVLHRQAVLARRTRPDGWACSRCAPSRCRRTRA